VPSPDDEKGEVRVTAKVKVKVMVRKSYRKPVCFGPWHNPAAIF